MRNYDSITNTGSGFLNWLNNTKRYRLRVDGKSCAEMEAEFLALSPTEQLAYAPLTSVPAAAAGTHWVVSSCGANETYVEVPDEEYFDTVPPGAPGTYSLDNSAGSEPIESGDDGSGTPNENLTT